MKDILSEIIAHKRIEIELQKRAVSLERLQEEVAAMMQKELGIQQGENKMLFTLVTKGKLDIDTAAEEAGVSVSEFEKLMSEAGYKVPETV